MLTFLSAVEPPKLPAAVEGNSVSLSLSVTALAGPKNSPAPGAGEYVAAQDTFGCGVELSRFLSVSIGIGDIRLPQGQASFDVHAAGLDVGDASGDGAQ